MPFQIISFHVGDFHWAFCLYIRRLFFDERDILFGSIHRVQWSLCLCPLLERVDFGHGIARNIYAIFNVICRRCVCV